MLPLLRRETGAACRLSPFGGPERCLSALRSGPLVLLLAAAAACCCGCEAAGVAAAAGAAAAAQLWLAGQAGDLTAQAIKPSLLLQLLLATHRRLALLPHQARYCRRAAAAEAAAAAVAVQPPLPATPCFARWVRYRPPGNGSCRRTLLLRLLLLAAPAESCPDGRDTFWAAPRITGCVALPGAAAAAEPLLPLLPLLRALAWWHCHRSLRSEWREQSIALRHEPSCIDD